MIKNYNFYIFLLALIAFLVILIIPSTSTLIHPDSSGYLEFAKYRTAFYPVFLDIFLYLGLSIDEIPIIQTFFFSISLYYLMKSVSRVCRKKYLLAMYTSVLIGNVWLVSLNNAILTESIYISLNMLAMAALINFFNTGLTRYIAIFSLMIGLAIGVRPSGAALFVLFPIIALSASSYFKNFKWNWVFALILPIIVTQTLETALYKSYHGNAQRESLLPMIFFGKGAMVQGNFKFYGPYKDSLSDFSKEIDLEFGKVNDFIKEIPYFWLKNQSIPNYEIYAQMKLFRNKRDFYAEKAGVSRDIFITELGKQRLLQEPYQFIKIGLYNYAASWGLRVTSFPPFLKEYNNWIKSQKYIPFNKEIKYLPMKGDKKPSIISMLAFPGLLIVGLLSGAIGIIFLTMLITRKKMPLPLTLSGIFSLSAHGVLIFSSFVNVATPRYTTTQFPILLLTFLFLFLWLKKNKEHK